MTGFDWAASITMVLALTVPLVNALYGLLRPSRDRRSFRTGLLTAGLVAAAWVLWARKDAREREQLEAVQAELAALKIVPEGRGFTASERKNIVEGLKGLAGPTAFVLANSSDAETAQYARQIVGILKDAGWKVPPSFGMIFTSIVLPGEDGVADGVVLGVSKDIPDRLTQALLAAFREGGVDVTLGPHWPGTEHPISILVGPRRRP